MSLAKELFISSRSVNEGLKRAALARLYDPIEKRVWTLSLLEALTSGLRFFMPAPLGPAQRGFPTAWAAEPLSSKISSDDQDRPVWPDPEGKAYGPSLAPLHDSLPQAAAADPELRELLVLVDALRAGKARERGIAAKELERRLDS